MQPAPVLPAYARRTGVARHEFEVWPPLDLQATGNRDEDILRLTEEFNKVLEKMIRQCPEQYFWMHKRWEH